MIHNAICIESQMPSIPWFKVVGGCKKLRKERGERVSSKNFSLFDQGARAYLENFGLSSTPEISKACVVDFRQESRIDGYVTTSGTIWVRPKRRFPNRIFRKIFTPLEWSESLPADSLVDEGLCLQRIVMLSWAFFPLFVSSRLSSGRAKHFSPTM